MNIFYQNCNSFLFMRVLVEWTGEMYEEEAWGLERSCRDSSFRFHMATIFLSRYHQWRFSWHVFVSPYLFWYLLWIKLWILTFFCFYLSSIWLLDVSILTSLSILGIIACIIDFAVPVISGNVFNPDNWTGIKERQFELICAEIVESRQMILDSCDMLGIWKESRPKLVCDLFDIFFDIHVSRNHVSDRKSFILCLLDVLKDLFVTYVEC